MDGGPDQAFRLNSAGGQFADHRASSNAGFSNWLGDVFHDGSANQFNNTTPDQFKHTAPDWVGTAVECSRCELNQPTVIGKRLAAFHGKPEHSHDAGDNTQRVAMRKSASERNRAERVEAE